MQVVETLSASLELALHPLQMGFGFVTLAVAEQSPELAADERASANAVEELGFAIVVAGVQLSEPAVVVAHSVPPFETVCTTVCTTGNCMRGWDCDCIGGVRKMGEPAGETALVY